MPVNINSHHHDATGKQILICNYLDVFQGLSLAYEGTKTFHHGATRSLMSFPVQERGKILG